VPPQAVATALCGGGYPEPLLREQRRARQWHLAYLQTIIQRDVKDVADIRDQDELLQLIELMAVRTATLFNASSVGNELSLERRTVEKYLSVLERLFLLRRLPAWHRNHAKRLIKTPKVHLIDCGLAAALNRITPADWDNQPEAFGHLLESFVVQQLICQAGWVDPDLRFYHYRDKDQIEVDLVIERGREVWGVEIKRAAILQPKDAAGLQRLATQAGKQYRGGILLYTGKAVYPLPNPDKVIAVPLSRLWSGE
jgi:predicted AAA+ superfamily ATPase